MRADRIGANFGIPPLSGLETAENGPDAGSHLPPPLSVARKRPKTGRIRDLTSPRLRRRPGNGPKRARFGISPPFAAAGAPESAQNGPDPGSHLPAVSAGGPETAQNGPDPGSHLPLPCSGPGLNRILVEGFRGLIFSITLNARGQDWGQLRGPPLSGPETAENGPDSGSHLPPPLPVALKRLKTGQIRNLTSPRLRRGP